MAQSRLTKILQDKAIHPENLELLMEWRIVDISLRENKLSNQMCMFKHYDTLKACAHVSTCTEESKELTQWTHFCSFTRRVIFALIK